MVLEGKYEVIRLLGEGGMGAVYEAHHKVIGRKVAVKFLHPEFAANPQAIQRFQQEAQIAGSLGHANICEVTDIGRTDDGSPYMLMPLLEGMSLGEKMNEDVGLLPTSLVFDIIYQTLTALQRAHDGGIVHRDLKPDNIFLTRMGDREDFIKILDFGISKIVSGSGPGAEAGLTTTGMVLGTPYYMAPEQARGAKGLDHRVDIYAMGVILYELLTGTTPFQAESYNEIIVKIVMEPFPTPRSLNSEIPVNVEEVILKAMARDPDERFSSARGFKRALLNRARESAMKLPGYLTRGDFTGDVPLLDTAFLEGEAFPRRSWVKPALAVSAIAVIAIALLVLQPWKREGKQSTATKTASPVASMEIAPVKSIPAEVRLNFLGVPSGGRVTVAGKRVWHGSIMLERTDKRLRYRATAPGYAPSEDWITPDRDRTTVVRLKKAVVEFGQEIRANKRIRRTMRTMRRNLRGATMRGPMMRASSAGMTGGGRKVVKGRHDTQVDSDYGED